MLKPKQYGLHLDPTTGKSWFIDSALISGHPMSPMTEAENYTPPYNVIGMGPSSVKMLPGTFQQLKLPEQLPHLNWVRLRPLIPVPYGDEPPPFLVCDAKLTSALVECSGARAAYPGWAIKAEPKVLCNTNITPAIITEPDYSASWLQDLARKPRTRPVIVMMDKERIKQERMVLPEGSEWLEIKRGDLPSPAVGPALLKHFCRRYYEVIQFGDQSQLPALFEHPWEMEDV